MGRFEEKSSLSVLLLLIHRSGACRRRPGRRTGSVGSPADKCQLVWTSLYCTLITSTGGGGSPDLKKKKL